MLGEGFQLLRCECGGRAWEASVLLGSEAVGRRRCVLPPSGRVWPCPAPLHSPPPTASRKLQAFPGVFSL